MLTIKWTWKCDLCGAEVVEHDNYDISSILLKYDALPFGWSCIKEKMICQKHRIVVPGPPPTDPTAMLHQELQRQGIGDDGYPSPDYAVGDNLDAVTSPPHLMDIPAKEIAPVLT